MCLCLCLLPKIACFLDVINLFCSERNCICISLCRCVFVGVFSLRHFTLISLQPLLMSEKTCLFQEIVISFCSLCASALSCNLTLLCDIFFCWGFPFFVSHMEAGMHLCTHGFKGYILYVCACCVSLSTKSRLTWPEKVTFLVDNCRLVSSPQRLCDFSS